MKLSVRSPRLRAFVTASLAYLIASETRSPCRSTLFARLSYPLPEPNNKSAEYNTYTIHSHLVELCSKQSNQQSARLCM